MSKEEKVRQIFEDVYTLLLVHLKASPGQREDFVNYHTRKHNVSMWGDNSWITEWRFGGTLGMGGKFWVRQEKFYVTCYKEDSGPAIRGMMRDVDKELESLHQKWFDLCFKINEEEINHE